MNSLADRWQPTPSTDPVLTIRNLTVSYAGPSGRLRVVHDVSLDVAAGEVVALVGESGSGKTTTAQAVIGLLAAGGQVDSGSIRLDGIEVTRLSDRRFNALRGAVVSLIPQDPGSSLNPVRTIGAQVAEVLQIHGAVPRAAMRDRVIALLDQVGLSDPALRHDQYPHELSGGMKQRVLIAIAIALKPKLIIADEPTSALDVTVQKRILDLIDDFRREIGTAVLFVTHDLAIAADRADRIVVLKSGRVQETGPVASVLSRPQSAYTRQLLSDAPALAAPASRPARRADGEVAVRVEGLVQDYPVRGQKQPFRALDGLSFSVERGSTHAIVGESGSGKTTAMRAIVGLVPPTAGKVEINGQDVTGLRGEALRQFRRSVQLVYQNPYASLDPRQTVGEIIAEPLRNFDPVSPAERLRQAAAMLEKVALPADVLGRRPAALSGGQRQRVAIARALILNPQVLVLDEAVSALDVTVQAQILRLLHGLQRDLGLTYLFVSHDLSVVRAIADTVTVLHRGREVESGPVARVFDAPGADYTRALIAAIPGARQERRAIAEGASA